VIEQLVKINRVQNQLGFLQGKQISHGQ